MILRWVFGWLVVALVTGCLPDDTRPEPARVLVTVVRDPELGSGPATFVSADGWTVRIERLLVSLGHLGLEGDGCNEYSSARYRRVLDMNRTDSQKLAEVYGLNACQPGFRMATPNESAVLGEGVTLADRDLMQFASVPISSPTGPTTARGMALYLVAQAEKEGKVVRFEWGFSDAVELAECQRRVNGELEAALPLKSGQTLAVSVTFEPRNLFRLGMDPKIAVPDSRAAAALGLPPTWLLDFMASADQVTGDANGNVSVEELTKVSVPGDSAGANLAEILRLIAYPSMLRYDDQGACTVDVRERGQGGMF